MLRREITYDNPFTEQKVTETHYFHISKADLVKMEIEEHRQKYTKDGKELTGMQAKLQRIIDAEDGKAIIAELEDIIRRSYGIREEGDKFRKTKEIWEDFASTEAYSQLFFEITTRADAAADFVNAVVPHNLDQIAAEVQAEAEKAIKQQEFVEAASSNGDDAPAESKAVEAVEAVADATGSDFPKEDDRASQIENATVENPVNLTQEEVSAMDSDDLKSGVATGRYKLS